MNVYPIVGKSVEESDRIILEYQFLEMNISALNGRLVVAGVKKACHHNALTKRICDTFVSDLKNLYEIIPRSIRTPVETSLHYLQEEITKVNEKTAENIFKVHGIPKEETLYALDSALISSPGSGTALNLLVKLPVKAVGKVIQVAKRKSRISNSFQKGIKEFSGKLSKELPLVQFRGENTSLKWWTTPDVANRFFSVQDVKKELALLTKFGERTHVSYAVIPKGAKTRYLVGKAGFQIDISKLEFLPGGGKQFYFPHFNPSWVRVTRPLPPQLPSRFKRLEGTFPNLLKIAGSRPLAILPENKDQEIEEESPLRFEVNGRDPSSASISISTDLAKKSLIGSVEVSPLSSSKTTISVMHPFRINNNSFQSGLLFNPIHPNKTRVPFFYSHPVKGISGSFLIHPKKFGKSVVSLSSKSIRIGGGQYEGTLSFSMKKPLNSQISGRIPVNKSFVVGFNLPLNRLHQMQVSLQLETNGLNKIVSGLLGRKLPLPSSITLVTLSKKNVLKTGKKVFKIVKKVFGFFRKKKAKPIFYINEYPLDPALIRNLEASLEELFLKFRIIVKKVEDDKPRELFAQAVLLLSEQSELVSDLEVQFQNKMQLLKPIDFQDEVLEFTQVTENLEEESLFLHDNVTEYISVEEKQKSIAMDFAPLTENFATSVGRYKKNEMEMDQQLKSNSEAISQLLNNFKDFSFSNSDKIITK